jgi:hypothetical protein
LWVTDDLNIIKDELETFFNDNKEITFILVTGLQNFKILASNCIVILGPPDITHHYDEYPLIKPVLDKNFNSTKHFISLNRSTRTHRYVSLCLLLAYELEKYGHITYLTLKDTDESDEVLDPYTIYHSLINETDTDPEELLTLYKLGRERLKTFEPANTDDPKRIYYRKINDNPGNFEDYLTNYYRNSFIELVNETTYHGGVLLTEKTLNCIYGCNFPIWISNSMTPNVVKSLGIDIFDDIINHDYQYENNLYLRIQKALKLNEKLLSDPDTVKSLWIENKHRFEKNIEFVRQELYDVYARNTKEQIHNALKQLNIHYEDGATY